MSDAHLCGTVRGVVPEEETIKENAETQCCKFCVFQHRFLCGTHSRISQVPLDTQGDADGVVAEAPAERRCVWRRRHHSQPPSLDRN